MPEARSTGKSHFPNRGGGCGGEKGPPASVPLPASQEPCSQLPHWELSITTGERGGPRGWAASVLAQRGPDRDSVPERAGPEGSGGSLAASALGRQAEARPLREPPLLCAGRARRREGVVARKRCPGRQQTKPLSSETASVKSPLPNEEKACIFT